MTLERTFSLFLCFALGAALGLFSRRLDLSLHPVSGQVDAADPPKGIDAALLSESCMEEGTSPSVPPSGPSFQEDLWKPGMPHPAEPEDPTLPSLGKASLRAIFGWKAEWHIHNSVCGFVSNPSEEVAYERQSGKTKVSFSSGWTIMVDDATGTILVPRDLPALSDEELVDMTWRAFVANDGLERWRNIYRRVAEDGTVRSSLSDVKLDEIRRVGDKAFVAWRLVESPPAEDGSFLRHVYWVDIRSRKIVIDGEEINEY